MMSAIYILSVKEGPRMYTVYMGSAQCTHGRLMKYSYAYLHPLVHASRYSVRTKHMIIWYSTHEGYPHNDERKVSTHTPTSRLSSS